MTLSVYIDKQHHSTLKKGVLQCVKTYLVTLLTNQENARKVFPLIPKNCNFEGDPFKIVFL